MTAILAALALLAGLVVGAGTAAAGSFPDLRDAHDPGLQQALDRAVDARPGAAEVWDAVRNQEFSAIVADVTDLEKPRVAGYNPELMLYAASLPKVAIVFGALVEIQRGVLELDDETHRQLVNMVRKSSNADASAVLRKVGIERLAEILQDDAHGKLYDPAHGGGLWVGKAYDKSPAWKRDPLKGISHAASAMQVARFFYGVMNGTLVGERYLPLAVEVFGEPGLNHKMVKGLKGRDVEIFRKSGTWRTYHADAAVVVRDELTYIAVIIDDHPDAARGIVDGIRLVDDVLLAERGLAAH